MTKTKTAVIVLAAGLGTRMKSDIVKVMHPLAGRPMVAHLMDTVGGIEPDDVAVVVGDVVGDVSEAVVPYPVVQQKERLGTAHAVLQARDTIGDFSGDVLVLYGDTPLVTLDTLDAMLDARASDIDPAVVVLGFTPADAGDYGRLILAEDGSLESIVEAKEATPEQLGVDLCNSGVMAIDGKVLWDLLDRVGNDNAKNEYYLTDIIALARGDGRTCVVVEADEDELIGSNSRVDLAEAEAILQDRLRLDAMNNGVTMTDPTTVFLSHDTKLGQDVSIGPNVFFGPVVDVADGATINAFCHLEGASIGAGATVGPFARLRPGAKVGETARVGNFVEIKNSVLDTGAKVNHLTYIGDAEIGAGANIGAGTITCNYDGFFKSKTIIGKGAFIGS
ncbi:MAG: bifunctional UDP-N-acetylglucosamine diphosphorylase/glucosamine-1-phosphate N-acetyltransferase GlmU, partial [Rhodospirillaceae bacterium]|nr:bifunctional UDP-N-acetylglucosamine diphosphorylase/glucosamine-1-phosphate N-acetyltransferase GlmU [Rhodospirillaceae bacterium]